MENQSNTGLVTKKSRNGKVIAGVVIACVAAISAIAVFLILSLSVSPAEKTVRGFMEAFKNNEYSEMMNYCDVDAFNDEQFGIFGYSGTNIIDYKVKSIPEPHKVKDRLVAEKSSNDDDEYFLMRKKHCDAIARNEGPKYGTEYIIIEDTPYRYVLESDKGVLDEYTFSLDVQYSTITGSTKRNVVSVTVCQSGIGSDRYEITAIFGIIH